MWKVLVLVGMVGVGSGCTKSTSDQICDIFEEESKTAAESKIMAATAMKWSRQSSDTVHAEAVDRFFTRVHLEGGESWDAALSDLQSSGVKLECAPLESFARNLEPYVPFGERDRVECEKALVNFRRILPDYTDGAGFAAAWVGDCKASYSPQRRRCVIDAKTDVDLRACKTR